MRQYDSVNHINRTGCAMREKTFVLYKIENHYLFRCVSFVFIASVLFLHKSWIRIVLLMLNAWLIFQYIRVDLFPLNQSFALNICKFYVYALRKMIIYIRNRMKINSTSHLLASLKIPVVDCVFEIDCVYVCVHQSAYSHKTLHVMHRLFLMCNKSETMAFFMNNNTHKQCMKRIGQMIWSPDTFDHHFGISGHTKLHVMITMKVYRKWFGVQWALPLLKIAKIKHGTIIYDHW